MNITELLFGVTELPSINESTTTTADAGITTRLPDQPRPFQEFDWSDSVDGPDVSLPVTPTEMPTLDLGDLPPVSPRRHRRANRNSNRHGDPTTTERSARAHDVIAWSSEDTARLDTSSDATVLPFAARQGRAYPRRQAARYILAGLTVASVVAVLTIVVANRPSQEPPATQPAPPPPSPPTVSAVLQSPSAAMRLRFSFTENPFGCDGGSRRLGTLSGAAAGERITFTSATVSGLLSGTADGAGNLGLIWQCNPNEAGQSWSVTATGQDSGASGTFTVTGAAAPPLLPAPTQVATRNETVGGPTRTWTNYTNAGGTEGPTISAGTTVAISCKVQGFGVQNGNPWWYRIASSPWNNQFYASADAFYNNGAASGSLRGTPFVDPAVPNC